MQAGIDTRGVIQRASACTDFVKSRFQAERGTVGAVRRHGLDHIGNGQNLGFQEDVLCLLYTSDAADE